MIRSRIALSVLGLSAALSAQIFYVNGPANPGVAWGAYAPGQLYPGGAGPGSAPELAAPLVIGAPAGITGVPPCGSGPQVVRTGGFALDNGSIPDFYSTDGVTLFTSPHPTYLGTGLPGVAINWQTPPSGNVSGLAFNSPAEVLYYVDANNTIHFQGGVRTFGAPFGTIGQVTPLPIGTVLTGLGYEVATGFLWACDQNGNVYSINSSNAMVISSFSVVGQAATCGAVGACWSGLDVDNSNGPLTPGPVACTGATNVTMHIAITDGFVIADGVNPGVAPIAITNCAGAGPIGGAWGLAFGADLQFRWGQSGPGGTTIPSLSNLPASPSKPVQSTVRLLRPLTTQNAPLNRVELVGLMFDGIPDVLTLRFDLANCAQTPPLVGGLLNLFLSHIPTTPSLITVSNFGLLQCPNWTPGALEQSSPTPFFVPTGIQAGTSWMMQAVGASGAFSDACQFRVSL